MYGKIFRRLWAPIGLLVMVASLVASCAPTTVTVEVPVKETVEVEVPVEQTVEVPVEVEVTAVPSAAGPTTVLFWTAPNPQQEAYWKDIVDDWNAANPNIQIEWEVIPAGASSEEVLLTAIATGTAPDISTNIFSGFAAQLVSSGAVVALDEEFPDFWDVVEGRQMRSILEKGWGYGGHQYVMPLYNNPSRYWWNKALLDEAGMTEAPRTYSDVLALCQAISVPGERYGIQYPSYKNWWDRWFGYLTLYYAASGGEPYVDLENNEVLFDNEAGMAVLSFMDDTFRSGCAPTEDLTDPLPNGILGGAFMGPWSIIPFSETWPDFEYVVAPPPVPDDYPEGEPVYVFADTKGMVMFSQSQQKAAAWEFIKWYFADVQHDVGWLEATNMPVVREDITINPAFDAYWAEHPVVKQYAEGVPYSVPPALIPATIEVQRIMGREMIEPIWFGIESPEDAMAGAVTAIEDYLNLGQ
ncbi:MAG: extracellular solute-binding protein [Chloroflexota bacterium]|nr:extracellular solute-binding protein [Chloroflexota bacterium]